IRVSASGSTSSVATFLGAVEGVGGVTGGGDVFFEGDLRPGQTLAPVVFQSNVQLGASASLHVDLGGPLPGVEFSQLLIQGALAVGGALNVQLHDGFTPSFGMSFPILTATGGVTGQF
ncbi:MAG TPA: hypothetical protein PJ982_20275, partial [Lacipirellulaceae bacterium]|nr:hypothetical protein [Lacipirellulaceae bacterium]